MSRTRRWWFVSGLGGVGLVAAIGGFVALAHPAPVMAGAGALSGRVTYAGAASAGTHVITKNPEVCKAGAPPVEEIVKGAGNALANVVVSVAAPAPSTLEKTPVEEDQVGCRYTPHVQAATLGSEITLLNSDSILHNVHTYVNGTKTLFNVGMPTKGMKIKRKLRKTGVVKFTCDAGHTWMAAYVHVFDHPYFAVTGTDGTYKIDGLPDGTYTATFWHEKLGTKTAIVTIAATGPASADLAF